jgi:predicted nucleic acid-binding protein
MTIVIDASVAMRAFIEESGSAEVRQFFHENRDQLIVAPALVLLEFNGALWKRFAAGTATRWQLHAAPDALAKLIVVRPLDEALAVQARKLALMAMDLTASSGDSRPFPASIYDCTYIAMAFVEGAKLVTADRRQAALAQSFGCKVRLLGL